MRNLYPDDIVAWATTQAALLRAGRESGLDKFPQQLPWQLSEVLESDFLPEL